MALSLNTLNSSCLFPRTNITSRPIYADRAASAGCLRTGKRNVNISLNKEVPKSLSSRSGGTANRGRVITMVFPAPRIYYQNKEEGIRGLMDAADILERNRIVMLEDMINEENGNRLLSVLLYLDGLDSTKDLFLFINCLGGDISPSLAVYDTMKSLRCSVVTRCLGYAFDISGFILAAGTKGNRSALPHSRIILRPPIGEANGQVRIKKLNSIKHHLNVAKLPAYIQCCLQSSEWNSPTIYSELVDYVVNEITELTKIRDHLYTQFAKHTGQSVEKIFDDLTDSKRFNAQEALEYGVIDRIPKPSRLSNTISLKEKHAPGLG